MNFERNRQAVMQQIEDLKKKRAQIQEEEDAPRAPAVDAEMINIVYYGAVVPYMEQIKEIMRRECNLIDFSNAAQAVDFCLDNNLFNVIVDMDEPTDWRQSTDVFNSVKTINPQARVLLCTKSKVAMPVKSLEVKGAAIITKPIAAKDLIAFIHSCAQE
jgi:hypothetical protein